MELLTHYPVQFIQWLLSRYSPLRSVLAPTLLLIIGLFSSASNSTTLLVLGDSLSAAYGLKPQQGWVTLLQQRYPQMTVINASISGETTAGGLNRLPQLLKREQPDYLLLELGANDGLRGLSLKAMKHNLNQMIILAQAADVRVGLIGIQIPPNYGRRYTEQFRHIYSELAQQHQLPLLPFMLEGIALEDSLMQADGLHPNAAAQALILQNITPLLQRLTQPDPMTK
ncbi:arylesterase [Ectothiorhodospiraceae bacterium BW-2]|nr:arylesterase [Ectothiorhodospiraceae bacterium BW-2]